VKSANFDRAFAKDMVSDHEKDIKEFRKEADKGRNPELKQFASQTMPTLEEHLKIARDLSGSSKGAGKASSKGAK
jgi:putative membrane protein